MLNKLNELLEKYEDRIEECNEQFDEDVMEIKTKDISEKRSAWLNNDISCLNAQIGVYECILKDIKELINEVSRRA